MLEQKENKTINIKGVDYNFEFRDYLGDASGVTRCISKKIIIVNDENIDELKKTIFHELLHAFFFECGLMQYFEDEILVTWLDRHFVEISGIIENLIKGR